MPSVHSEIVQGAQIQGLLVWLDGLGWCGVSLLCR